jgi:hypothetical protein
MSYDRQKQYTALQHTAGPLSADMLCLSCCVTAAGIMSVFSLMVAIPVMVPDGSIYHTQTEYDPRNSTLEWYHKVSQTCCNSSCHTHTHWLYSNKPVGGILTAVLRRVISTISVMPSYTGLSRHTTYGASV